MCILIPKHESCFQTVVTAALYAYSSLYCMKSACEENLSASCCYPMLLSVQKDCHMRFTDISPGKKSGKKSKTSVDSHVSMSLALWDVCQSQRVRKWQTWAVVDEAE